MNACWYIARLIIYSFFFLEKDVIFLKCKGLSNFKVLQLSRVICNIILLTVSHFIVSNIIELLILINILYIYLTYLIDQLRIILLIYLKLLKILILAILKNRILLRLLIIKLAKWARCMRRISWNLNWF